MRTSYEMYQVGAYIQLLKLSCSMTNNLLSFVRFLKYRFLILVFQNIRQHAIRLRFPKNGRIRNEIANTLVKKSKSFFKHLAVLEFDFSIIRNIEKIILSSYIKSKNQFLVGI